jgi:hypothetical protein
LAVVHAASEDSVDPALRSLQAAITVADHAKPLPAVHALVQA